MKSVLISIKPKWCELIVSGKKTVEVRKTKPKLETPFKCYIYCTKNGKFMVQSKTNPAKKTNQIKVYGGKVIGEFVCDGVYITNPIEESQTVVRHYPRLWWYDGADDCMHYTELEDYLQWKIGYGWHISDLVIYDKPRELSEFYTVDIEAVRSCKNRHQTYHQFTDTGYIKNGFYCEETGDWCKKCKTKPITRPPQSWCYVESEVEGE